MKGSMEVQRITRFIIHYCYHSALVSPARSCMAPAWPPRKVKSLPAARQVSLALTANPGHQVPGDPERLTVMGSSQQDLGSQHHEEALRCPPAPSGVQGPLKSGP